MCLLWQAGLPDWKNKIGSVTRSFTQFSFLLVYQFCQRLERLSRVLHLHHHHGIRVAAYRVFDVDMLPGKLVIEGADATCRSYDLLRAVYGYRRTFFSFI